jgi:hypothetical protein
LAKVEKAHYGFLEWYALDFRTVTGGQWRKLCLLQRKVSVGKITLPQYIEKSSRIALAVLRKEKEAE